MRPAHALITVKLLHTAVWAVLVGCIIGLPVAALLGHFRLAALLGGAVVLETVVLVFNGWRCPLTAVAGRYTDERPDNFDIYLPLWLARHNKQVFGTLYLAGALVAAWAWLR